MSKPLVYISRKIREEGLEELKKHCLVKMHNKITPPSRRDFLANIKKADAIMTSLAEKVDAEVFKANPKLKIVANYAVGFDNIDIQASKKYNIPATNTPGDYSTAVAEHAMALIMNLSKRVLEGDRFVRAGKYKFWDPLLLLGNDLKGKTLGIIGTGRIGSALVRIAQLGFGMDIIYYDVVRNGQIEKDRQAKFMPLNDVLAQADFISVHVPLLPTTKHLLSDKQFKLMKKTAYLVNTSRGPVIDEKALVKALKAKTIAGAGLDVFEFEPKLATGLSKISNVILTPHIASATYAARAQMAKIASDNILDVLVRHVAPRNQIKI